MTERLIAGIEAGGTKILCAVATGDGAVIAQARIATRDPDATFRDIASFYGSHGPFAAGGVGSFGPLDLDRDSPDYGRITTTPKAGWRGVDMLGRVAAIIRAPVAIDTDVNCAARAEAKSGAGRGLSRLCYVTVGTGIGVGIVDGMRADTGIGHPEVGHTRIPRAADDDFAGSCPSHGDCAEGLASGPAIHSRWGVAAEDLADGHIGWAYEAQYLAALCVNLTYTVRPQRIILGGGVLERASLLGAVRASYLAQAAGYALDRYASDVDRYLCAPDLTDPSPGLVGALDLAATLAA